MKLSPLMSSAAKPLLLALATFSVLANASISAAPDYSEIRLRPQHDQIAALRKSGPVVRGVKIESAPAPLTSPPPGLLERSTILAYRGHWTIVPKHAVLFVPKALQPRIAGKPEGTLLPWAEFYANNRGWLHLQQVQLSDARGKTSLNPQALAAHPMLGRVVVAICQGGPISMPPLAKSSS